MNKTGLCVWSITGLCHLPTKHLYWNVGKDKGLQLHREAQTFLCKNFYIYKILYKFYIKFTSI